MPVLAAAFVVVTLVHLGTQLTAPRVLHADRRAGRSVAAAVAA